MKLQHQQYSQTGNSKAHFFDQKRFTFLYLILLLTAVFFAIPTLSHAEQGVSQITVYKSPTCRCCNKWIKHLEKNGFSVEAHNREDMSAIKHKMGIQPKYQSCHTAVVDGYYIEGHVPASDIKQLLAEKPKAAGLTVPGMPKGSPGMEVGAKDPYSVLLVDKEGNQKVYNKY
jgi:hypothetical protein